MSLGESTLGRKRVRLAGGSAEPPVSVEQLASAIEPEHVETFRPLLPVGYAAGVAAYRSAVEQLSAKQLTTHYTDGLSYFHDDFVPMLKSRVRSLAGDVWDLNDYVAYAAGSDVDFIAHLVEAVARTSSVALYPGDWHGFRVGCTDSDHIVWDASGAASLACLCIPSVRNGHVTDGMLQFLSKADSCLLNLNLYPTLRQEERTRIAQSLAPVLDKSVLSISFSRGFGLTASQLGVALVPKLHPMRAAFQRQWNWFTYFYNAIAARAFAAFDLDAAQRVDRTRADWVAQWLDQHDLPSEPSGSYYVKSFAVDGVLPSYLQPLHRDGIVRLCFKPPQT